MIESDIGATQVARQIRESFLRSIEADSPIDDADLAERRRRFLERPGVIAQTPHVEITPSYMYGPQFNELGIPTPVREVLSTLHEFTPNVGIHPPYLHQTQALENFFHPDKPSDLIVATGTGSGKTESFLYSILGMLACEAERPSFQQHAVRALLLYPLNALVSDQTSRLRRLFGDERVARYFRERSGNGRHPYFGMYTGRTPYPNTRTSDRDKRRLADLVRYYTDLDGRGGSLVNDLRDRGRWPAKDLTRFAKSGIGQYTTGLDDRELLTRHEMQLTAPDILVTNYSMLEYMLLRPIERPIFDQTRAWLQADEKNQLLLVLDEAHMYRGATGAEVGLLIRRLGARLGIDRDRIRCILTSASLEADDGDAGAIEFARALTAEAPTREYTVIRGSVEKVTGSAKATPREAAMLATVDGASLSLAESAEEVRAALGEFSSVVQIPADATLQMSRQSVGAALAGFGPANMVIQKCSGHAIELRELAAAIFDCADDAAQESAIDGLLMLGSFARRPQAGRDQQPVLPSRIHMMYRAAPAIFACIDQNCTAVEGTRAERIVGQIYESPRVQCYCGSRVYEILSHEECGAVYVRGYASTEESAFLWHEPGGRISREKHLKEVKLYLGDPHPAIYNRVAPVFLDVQTGRVAGTPTAGTRVLFRSIPSKKSISDHFARCVRCLKAAERSKYSTLASLATTGESAFASLIRHQFTTQTATLPRKPQNPNGGRKILVFSDGRQKAARLARDMPRDVEDSTMREALVLAVQALAEASGKSPTLDQLYAGFVAVCCKHDLSFFDGDDQIRLKNDVVEFANTYDADLLTAFEFEWQPNSPLNFRSAVFRQLCHPTKSLIEAHAVQLSPSSKPRRLLLKKLTEKGIDLSEASVDEIASAWTLQMIEHGAFDPALPNTLRRNTLPFYKGVQRSDAFKRFFDEIGTRCEQPIDVLREQLFAVLSQVTGTDSASTDVLHPSRYQIHLALDRTWVRCSECGHIAPTSLLGKCINHDCKSVKLEMCDPDHRSAWMSKDHLRAPLLEVLSGRVPMHINAEEHTAQLSQRDESVAFATTEKFELRFQNVDLGDGTPVVDVLSCTTTMEVGIDIGGLTAVALRTVPPMRENYQQRAGRAGRRGSAVSTVLTYSDGAPHDSYYFENPHAMISGPISALRIKDDNQKLARRHIHSYLLQTFFHETIDPEDGGIKSGDVMSALGSALDFFRSEDSTLSFKAFRSWTENTFGVQDSPAVVQLTNWLPENLLGPARAIGLAAYTTDTANEFLKLLEKVGNSERIIPQEGGTRINLLDVLFDAGLLPKYAFPTDVCSFYIEARDEKGKIITEERPQLAKIQAVSEYAPGRTIVVNKRTYRSGGIYFPPVDKKYRWRPAVPHFADHLEQYVGCTRCPYVRLDDKGPRSDSPGTCPVCRADLIPRDLLSPDGFYPEDASSVDESNETQIYTNAGSAQMPEFVDRSKLQWQVGLGNHLRTCFEHDIELIVVNRGDDNEGFGVCEVCGAAWPNSAIPPGGQHLVPFLIPAHRGLNRTCNGNIRRQVFLSHRFRTDTLLLEMAAEPPISLEPTHPWVNDALLTLAEAFALGSTIHLNIDPNEISAGYSHRTSPEPGTRISEIFLYDTASGGAGYSADAGREIGKVIQQVRSVLADCPADCARSCTRCLRHYRNRFLHGRLDRHLALSLFEYSIEGRVPELPTIGQQKELLAPLRRYFELEGYTVDPEVDKFRPLSVSNNSLRIVAGAYPALLDHACAEDSLRLASRPGERAVAIPDFALVRDLPAVHRHMVTGVPLA
ncbi:DEAD/DEAH box helicase [Nocardia aurea]|uniref:DEAD/DEAH box helicase n=1 Tax=Nocardia aurea TaxID=2144174 RepID=UPI000D697328|nr:DEAD/DEAH box helicase [Nocardia aurea]